jgi:preprotein translocase subunit SecG
LQLLVNIILVVNVFVCVALVAIVLLQRSEGGALGMGGGSPSGFMTARGAGDLLTRTTWILAGIFFVLSIALTVLTGKLHGGVDTLINHINLNSPDLATPQKTTLPASPAAPAPVTTLQAPAPQTQSQTPAQTPAQAPAQNNALSILAAPTIQSKVAPAQPAPTQAAPTQTAPAQQAPEKK